MNPRTAFVYERALQLDRRQLTITGRELAREVNDAGLRTSYGARYQGGRGIYTLIRCTYTAVLQEFGPAAADVVANAFVNSKGQYAYL